MVLAYHQVLPGHSPYVYSVTCSLLEEHLKLIKESEESLQTKPHWPQVTFDDGHITQYQYAVPILEKIGVRAAFCVTAGWVDTQSSYMTATQLRELISLGHEVYGHGWSHKMLTQCTPSELREELQYSRQVLEDILGRPVDALSVPHGRWNDRVLECCSHAGYRTVYISEPHIEAARSGTHVVGRLMVTRGMSARSLVRADKTSKSFALTQSTAKRAARAVIGDARYRALWRFLGAKKDHLPDPIPSQQPTRILQLISSGGFYGAERVVINLTKALEGTRYESVIGVFRNSRNPHLEIVDRAKQGSLLVDVIPCKGRFDWSTVRQIRNIIRRYGIDIVHTHGSKANFYGLLAARRLRVPLVATYHLDWPDRSFRLRCYHVLDRLILRSFSNVVAVSDAVELSLRRAGLSPLKLRTIVNGVDLAPFAVKVRGSPPAPDSRFLVGVVGRLTPQKGHEYLLRAAPEILIRFPNVLFSFVGDGPERKKLEEMISALKLERNVVFAGEQFDMPSVYESIGILVLPSVNEGTPMTLIEGLAAGRPIVATRVGGIPKLIRHGETGLLVDPANPKSLRDAVLELLSDPARRFELATRGQRWAIANCSAEAMAAHYEKVYREAVNRSR